VRLCQPSQENGPDDSVVAKNVDLKKPPDNDKNRDNRRWYQNQIVRGVLVGLILLVIAAVLHYFWPGIFGSK